LTPLPQSLMICPIFGSKEVSMPEVRDKLSIYVPQEKLKENPIERLMKLGRERDRSVNYLVVQAILEYLAREEKKR
jgi:hypothetical protein